MATIRNLPPAWRGAVLGTFMSSVILYFTQSFILLKTGGIGEVIVGGLQFLLVVILAAFVLTLVIYLARKMPTFFVFTALASLVLLAVVFYSHPIAMILLPILCIVSFSIIGAWIYTYIHERRNNKNRRFQVKRDVPLIICVCVLAFIAVSFILPGNSTLDMLDLLQYEKRIVAPLDIEDPSLPGEYQVGHLTYGAENTYRKIFNQEHSLITYSVDGSNFIEGWSKRRTKRFGFGPDELPLNGHVWYPEATGQFPLILIVHGNHAALEYSDPGYDYLAELLASRGYIVASAADKNAKGFQAVDTFTDFTIELEEKNANKVSVPLSELGTLYPMLEGDFTKWPFNKMGMSREAVFQNYSLSLSYIKLKNNDFDVSTLRTIRFLFDRVEQGNIYLRNIGIRRND